MFFLTCVEQSLAHTEIHYLTIEVLHTFYLHILVQQFFTNGYFLVSGFAKPNTYHAVDYLTIKKYLISKNYKCQIQQNKVICI
jgi:hypothetical protein